MKKHRVKKPSKEEITELYWNQKLSLSKIAEIFVVSTQTVLNWMRDLNIERRTVSDSLKGREILWAEKISTANIGKTLTQECREKISKARLSRNIIPYNKGLTKAANPDIITNGTANEAHWNWKGGISKENIRIRQSSEYKQWRKECFSRDGYKCTKCLSTYKIQVHHIIPFSFLLANNMFLYDTSNGITVCEICHYKLHNKTISNLIGPKE